MMELFWHHFPISGVETYLFIPPLVMLVISSLTSMAGVSGAFILLPFQMSVLEYTAPGVTATNFVYNIVAIPFGVYRHIKQKRLAWHLFFILMLGTLPGVFLGYYIRVVYLPDPARFKFFAGFVLAFLAYRTIQSIFKDLKKKTGALKKMDAPEVVFTGGSIGLVQTKIYCGDKSYSFSTVLLLLVSMMVGILGGAYGIGGGAFLAPFCISVLNLPIFIVSGAALFSTWINSVVAASFYAFAPVTKSALNTSPDWVLGALFGLGGMMGIYVGTFMQKRFSAVWIKSILAISISIISARYIGATIIQFFK